MTKWSPDTCDCVINIIDWDNDIIDSVDNKCVHHASVPDDQIMAKVYHNENKLKNEVLQHIGENSLSYSELTENGDRIPDTKKIDWSFDESRKLQIVLKENKKTENDSIKSVVLNKFKGKVNII